MNRIRFLQALLFLLLVYIGDAHAFEWRDLWQTPEQRAAKLYKEGNYEQLAKDAPNDLWKALAADGEGQYSQAVETLSSLAQNSSNPSLLYNLATAAVKAGDYPQAIELFDEVLSSDSEHASAKHNKAIAEQLLELQQQDQQQGEQQQGEQQQGEQQQGEQQQGEQQQGEQQQGEQQQGGQQQSEQQQGEQNDEAERQKAEAMLQQAATEGEENQQEEPGQTFAPSPEPLTEQQQSAEQILRRIPDDPAGLLRSKLRQSHINKYPEVIDSDTPW